MANNSFKKQTANNKINRDITQNPVFRFQVGRIDRGFTVYFTCGYVSETIFIFIAPPE